MALLPPSQLFLRRRGLSVVGGLVLAIAGLSCGERATGPATRGQASLAFAPVFSGHAALVHSSLTAFGLTIDNVRIRLARGDGSVVIDTVVTFAPGAETLSITLSVEVTGAQETFQALIELRDGTTVLFSGSQNVAARPGQGTSVPDIETEYVGPGSEATQILIAPRDTVIPPTAQVAFTAEASDAENAPVLDIPIDWALSDSTAGTVSGAGLFTATAVRGTTWVIARMPNLIADSVLVTVVPPATHLALFSGSNQSGAVGAALPAPIVIEARAADNLPVPGVLVTFALTLGGGTLSADSVVTDNLGRASTTLTLDSVPGARTVEASSAGLGSLDIGATGDPGAPTRLVITQQPSANVPAGQLFSTVPIIGLRDQFDNVVPTSGVAITVAPTSPAMGTLGGTLTVQTDPTGHAVFPDITVNGPTGVATLTFTSGALTAAVSDPITVEIGPATSLVVEGGTEITVIAGEPVPAIHAVRVVDAGGNGIADAAVLLQQDDAPDTTLITGADGRAHLSALGDPEVVGIYILTFSSGSLAGSPAVITVTVIASSASKLFVAQQPSATVVSGMPLAQQPQVQILDSFDNPSATAGVVVTAEVLDGPSTLGGTMAVATNAAGLATFTDLSISGPDGPMKLRFTAPGLADAFSDDVTISPAPATHLAFTTPPTNGAAGVPFTVVVSVRDAQNNVVADYNAEVGIALGVNPNSATLSGTLSLDAVNGVATFNGISIDSVANGYTMIATAEGLIQATSNPFNMVAGAGTPSQLAFTTQPVDVQQGASFSVAVTARDAFDDPAPGFTGPITIAIANNPGAGGLGGQLTVNAVSGVATFNGLSISEDGAGYTLVATAGALTPDTSNAFNVLFSGETFHDTRRSGDVAIYKNYIAWTTENKDEVVLQDTPFKLAPGFGDYSVRTMDQLSAGIPAQTSLIIITSASNGNQDNQITEQIAGAANLDVWVRNGGWLAVHAGDNATGMAYQIPGMLEAVDDSLTCTGTALAAADHAFIRGPDAVLGTADDLFDGSLSFTGPCHDNHGALNGKLPGNAEVLLREAGPGQRPTYATYTLGAGRVIVTTLTLEHASHPTQTMVNHLYWAINGVNAGPAQPVYRTVSWLGGDGNWSDGTKWDIGAVPASDDSVRIVAPGTYTVTMEAARTVDVLEIGGASGTQTLFLASHILTVTSVLDVAPGTGALHLASGQVTGPGDILVGGHLLWEATTISGGGVLRIEAGGTTSLSTQSRTLNGGRQFEIIGDVVWDGGQLSLGDASPLVVAFGGTLEIAGDLPLSATTGGGTMLNQGTVTKVSGIGQAVFGVPFTNEGTVEILQGEISLTAAGTVTHTGPFIVSDSAMLRINAGTHTVSGTITGAGAVQVGGGNVTLNGATVIGRLLTGGGTVTINNALTVSDSIWVNNGTLSLNAGGEVTAGRVVQNGGTLQGVDTLIVLQSLRWTGGTMAGTGVTHIPDTALVEVIGGLGKNVSGGRRFELDGTMLWTGGTVSVGTGSHFEIGADGEVDMQGDFTLTQVNPGTMLNLGRITKTAGTGLGVIALPFTNSGVIEAEIGTLRITPPATATHDGTFLVAEGAILEFAGTGTNTLDSTITGAGQLRVSGSTLTMNGTVAVTAMVVTSGNSTVNGPFVVNDSLTMSSGTVTINTALPVSLPLLRVNSGTLGGTATVNVMNAFAWDAGTMTGTGQTRITPTANAAFTTGAAKSLSGARTLELLGTGQMAGNTNFGNSSAFIVAAGANLEIVGDMNFTPAAGSGTVTNLGTIRRTGGSGNATFGVPFANSGLVQVHTGTLRFQSSVAEATHGGSFEVFAPAIIDYAIGPYALTSTVSGTGILAVGGATVTSSAALTQRTLRVTSGTLTLTGSGTVELPVVGLFGGVLQGADSIVVLDSLDWRSGTMTGTGVTRVTSTATATLSTAAGRSLLGGRQFILEGNGSLSAASHLLGDGSQFVIDSGATFSFLDNISFLSTTGGGTITNRGVILKAAGTGISAINSGFVNEGSVAVLAGTFRIGSPAGVYLHTGDFAVSSPGIFDVTGAGTHTFTGSVAGTGAVGFYLGGTVSYNGLFAAQSLSVSGGTVDFSGSGQIEIPSIQLIGGTLQGTDTLIVTDSMTWSGGTHSGLGATHIGDTATLAITTAAGRMLIGGRQIEVAGTLVAINGTVNFGGGSTLLIEPGAEFDVQGAATFAATTGSGLITHQGLLTRTTAVGTANFGVPFVNEGAVEVEIGVLALNPALGTMNHTGNFTVTAPGALTFTGGAAVAHNVSGTLTGTGLALVSAGTTTFANAVSLGVYNSTGGATYFNHPDFTVDTLRGTAGSYHFNSGSRHEVPIFLMTGVWLSGVDTIAVTDSLYWTSGTMGETGRTEIPVGTNAVLATTGAKLLTGGRSLDIAGSLLWQSGTFTLATNSPIRVAPGGVFTLAGAATMNGTGTVLNQGTFRRTAVAGAGTFQVPFTNEGIVDVELGVLSLTAPAGTVTHSGPFTVDSGAVLEFAGVGTQIVNAPISGAGSVRMVGTSLTLNDSLDVPILLAAGVTMNVNGPVSPLDTLRHTTGTLSLDGGVGIPITRLFLATPNALQGADSLIVLDSMDWSRGTMGGSGVTHIVETARLAISSTNGKGLAGGRTLNIAGDAEWIGGPITLTDASPFTVAPTGDFVITGNATMTGISGSGPFQNYGSVRRTTATGILTINAPFENHGVVQASTGTLTIASPATHVHSGTFEITMPAQLIFQGGTHVIDDAITGTGRLAFGATTATVNGSVAVSSLASNAGSTTILGPLAPLDSMRLTNGTLSLNHGAQVQTGRLLHHGGILSGMDTLLVHDSLHWGGGTMNGSGRTVLANTGNYSLAVGGKTLADTRVLELGGTGAWTLGSIEVGAGAVLQVAPTGILDIRYNATLSGTGTLLNEGQVLRSVTTATASLAPTVVNHGSIQVTAGILTFTAATGSSVHNGTFAIDAGATMSFIGAATHQMNSTVIGAGTVTVAGSAVTLNGSLGVSNVTYSGGSLTANGPFVTDTLRSMFAGQLTLNSNVTIPPGSLYSLQNAGGINGTGTLLNQGTFQKTTAHTATIAVPFENVGVLAPRLGIAIFTRPFTHAGSATLYGDGTLQVTSDSVIAFDGDISPGLQVGSFADSVGTLTISGTAPGTVLSGPINIQIGGATAPALRDQLTLGGQATLTGVINVTVINGFVPTPSQIFDVVTFTAGTNVAGVTWNLPLGWTFDNSNPTSLRAIAPPP